MSCSVAWSPESCAALEPRSRRRSRWSATQAATSVTRLEIRGALKRTLESTNPCESMIECVRRTSRNVKRWQSGDMALRWTAAGMLEAEQQFRKVIGYRDLAKARDRRRARPDRQSSFIDRRGGRYARHRLTITPGPSSRSSTTIGCAPRLLEGDG